jgi:hypothetical protein
VPTTDCCDEDPERRAAQGEGGDISLTCQIIIPSFFFFFFIFLEGFFFFSLQHLLV